MEIGIYPRQMPIMGLLKEHDGYSQSELAARMHVKPPTVTVTVHRLEKKREWSSAGRIKGSEGDAHLSQRKRASGHGEGHAGGCGA